MIKKIRTADLRVGMFVDRVDSDWLSSPWVMSRFKIKSEEDLNKLREYDIRYVFIDTSKGLSLEGVPEAAQRPKKKIGLEDVFEIDLDEFWVSHKMPVDIYRYRDKKFELLLKSGLPYSEEAEELFRSSGLKTVWALKKHRDLFDRYKKSLESMRESRRTRGYAGVYVNPVKVRSYLNIKSDFHPIDPVVLEPGSRPGFDIYIWEENKVSKALAKGAMLGADDKDRWIERRQELAIRRSDRRSYEAYLAFVSSRIKDEKARAAIVRENSRMIVEDLAKSPRSKDLMRKARKTVVSITNIVIDNPATFYGLMKMRDYDYDTYTHSVNVATMCSALAIASGVNGMKDLEMLSLGAMLHDIGKSRVDHAIINKPGKLTPEEYGQAKEHVTLGYEMIKDNESIPEPAFYPLLQHHEKLGGNGYPKGLSGGEIHLFGRISAIIDIYDALTTRRPYKKPLKPFDALSLISRAVDDYDKELFSLFVNLMHRQKV